MSTLSLALSCCAILLVIAMANSVWPRPASRSSVASIHKNGRGRHRQPRAMWTASTNKTSNKVTPGRIYCNAMKKYSYTKNQTSSSPFYRLTPIVTPSRYKLRLRIDNERKKLFGHVMIRIRIHNRTNLIEMNGFKLRIVAATFSTGNIRVDANMVYYCPGTQTLVLHFPKILHQGGANITMNFVANLTDLSEHRILNTYYENHERITLTDLGPIDARRLFPSWDEPHYKAIFDLHMIVPRNFLVVSNQAVAQRRSYSPVLDEIKFNSTPPISTHQLAVLVASKLHTMASLKNMTGIKLNLITADDSDPDQWTFALETAEILLEYFEYYFTKQLPLNKLDLFVSKHYNQASLEKLGLIYFGHDVLSVPNRTIVEDQKLQMVATTLAHSVSHQWLGNSVTFGDWSQFWLFESLNQLMEKQAIGDLFPQWRTWQQYTAQEMSLALRLDSSIHAQSVLTSLLHPANVSMMYPYGVNVYRKATFLLHMLKSNLNEEIFRRAIQIFIKKHWMGTANPNDLWTSFIVAIDELNVRDKKQFHQQAVKAISSWFRLPGFPVLHVEERQDGDSRVLKIRQERFIELRPKNSPMSKNVWAVPVSIVNSFNPFSPSNQAILNNETSEMRIPAIWDSEWVKLNPFYSNFYRVHYSDSMLERFWISIEEKLLPPLDRLNLVDDVFAMVRSGYTATPIALKLLWSFFNEDNHNVWSTIISALTNVQILISNIDSEPDRIIMINDLEYFVQHLLKKAYQRIGWYPDQNQSPVGYKMKIAQFAQSELRRKILCTMQQFHDENFIRLSKKKYLDYINGESDLPLDILECVFRAFGSFREDSGKFNRNQNRTKIKTDEQGLDFQGLFKYYDDYDMPEARHLFSMALGSTDRPKEIEQVIQYAFKSVVRPEHGSRMLLELARNSKQGRIQVLTTIQKRFFDFLAKFAAFNEMYGFLRDFMETFSKRGELNGLEQLFLNYSSVFRPLQPALKFSLEKVQIMEEWFKRDHVILSKFLKQVRLTVSQTENHDDSIPDYGEDFMETNSVGNEYDQDEDSFDDRANRLAEMNDDSFFSFEDNFEGFDDEGSLGRRRRKRRTSET